MVRSQGPATNAAGLVDVKRSSPIKKGKGKEKMPPPAKPPANAPEVHPNPVCLRDFNARDAAGNLINHQGMFRKVLNLNNGKLQNNLYEGFFTILLHGTAPNGASLWETANGFELPSTITWAAVTKDYTILPDYKTDGQPHPPVWWRTDSYPDLV